ncbi:MAG: phospholipase [Chloroflexi bacterium]|nr:phospholipase [Chloroflexota bacterium]
MKVGKVEFYAGPKDVGAPDDLEQVIVDFIDGAEKRLEIAVQELESVPIAEAIIRARVERKLLVKLVIEHDYLRASRARALPWERGGPNETNREIHDAVLRASIDVKPDYNASIFHQKFIVRDGTALLTGSTNFTPTGVHNNLNHIVIVNDEKTAKIYRREFREIARGHFGKRNEGHDPAPADLKVSNVPIRVLFAPDHSPEMEIMKQMAKAKKRVDFAIFTFSQSSGIDDQMLLLRNANITVEGALDRLMANQDWAAARPLQKEGVKLSIVPKTGTGVGKLHHKLMVIDEQVIIAGSFNYTGPANRLNDENIIILGDLESTGQSKQDQKKLAKYALKEIDRIWDTYGVPI